MTAFGVMLPSFASGDHPLSPPALRQLSRRIESLGFDSIWAIDHFLPAPMYARTWMDPFLTLTFVAANTTRVKVGPCVLVLPLRNPVHVARDAAALNWLSGERLVLGVGAGWNPIEFEASQVSRSERGRRTDESIEILRRLLSGRSAAYSGKYFRFPELRIEPQPNRPPPIWVGGGSQPRGPGSTGDTASVPESVIVRVANADGWISPSTSTPVLIESDWARIVAAARAAGRDPAGIMFAHMNSFHLVDTDDPELAHREQRDVFERYLGRGRPWEFARECYLVGSLDDVVTALRRRIEIGIRYFILGPIVSEPRDVERQLELLVAKVIPAIAALRPAS